jgi:sec-independent protein translocase protein TatA
MFDVGGGELLLILIVVLLLFGPSKLPELARSFGKGMAQFRKAQADLQRNFNALSDEINENVQEFTQDQTPKPKQLPSLEPTKEYAEQGDSMPPNMPSTLHDEAQQNNVQHDNVPHDNVQHDAPLATTIQIRPAEYSIARHQDTLSNHSASYPNTPTALLNSELADKSMSEPVTEHIPTPTDTNTDINPAFGEQFRTQATPPPSTNH